MTDTPSGAEQLVIDTTLVRSLVSTEFPHWADLPVRPVEPGGWDNRTFRLGEHMLVRLPSAAHYGVQVEKEQRWLPRLAPLLPLPIPAPPAMGEPAHGYPWRWSIYRWLDGDPASSEHIADLRDFANSLAQFLRALQRIDPTGGPAPGAHNFQRGGALATYDAQTRQALAALEGRVDCTAATEVWEEALASIWRGRPVWIHGDMSLGNLLLQGGRLSAVIDFGNLGVGDPACDLALAWTLFAGESREIFRAELGFGADTWVRGRGWALWKALIVAAGLTDTNAAEGAQCWRIIEEVLEDRRHSGC